LVIDRDRGAALKLDAGNQWPVLDRRKGGISVDRSVSTETPSPPPQLDEGYRRGLSARNVQMIAIGGAIGTSLFYGSGGAI
jgi:amino acid permease